MIIRKFSSIIKIPIIEYENNIKSYNDYKINNMPYKKALSMYKRSYFEYYISLKKSNHLLIFTFFTFGDCNSKIIKFSVFLFTRILFDSKCLIFQRYNNA